MYLFATSVCLSANRFWQEPRHEYLYCDDIEHTNGGKPFHIECFIQRTNALCLTGVLPSSLLFLCVSCLMSYQMRTMYTHTHARRVFWYDVEVIRRATSVHVCVNVWVRWMDWMEYSLSSSATEHVLLRQQWSWLHFNRPCAPSKNIAQQQEIIHSCDYFKHDCEIIFDRIIIFSNQSQWIASMFEMWPAYSAFYVSSTHNMYEAYFNHFQVQRQMVVLLWIFCLYISFQTFPKRPPENRDFLQMNWNEMFQLAFLFFCRKRCL